MKKSNRSAYEAALHLLEYRAQSEYEIRTKLKRRGYEDEDIEKAVEKLYFYHYLNDEELAEEIFVNYRDFLLYGDRYIQGKMKLRGLTCRHHLTEAEEREKAKLALEKKAAAVPDIRDNYRRAAGFLLRRGFSYAAVSFALGNKGEF